MRKTAFIAAFLLSIGLLPAQENNNLIKTGTTYVLGDVSASGYEHIDLPRKNFIIKRGALANYNALEGIKVIAEEVATKTGKTEVVLRRKDGRHFFRFWPTLPTDIDKALAKGELMLVKS
ncbi:MAG: hypothetical protein WBM83_04905 [Flavobacteriaceae bacterium]